MKTPLSACLALVLASAMVRAETSLTVGNAPGFPGTTTSVPVYLSQASNVVVAQFEVSFNTGRVSQAGAVLAPRVAGQRVKARDVAPGLRRVVAYSLSTGSVRATNKNIATLPFSLDPHEYVGSGRLVPTNALLVRRDETRLSPITLTAGSIFAQPVYRYPDGTASLFIPSKPGTNYIVQATRDFALWVNIFTNTATSDFLETTDMEARNFDYRFYRTLEKP